MESQLLSEGFAFSVHHFQQSDASSQTNFIAMNCALPEKIVYGTMAPSNGPDQFSAPGIFETI